MSGPGTHDHAEVDMVRDIDKRGGESRRDVAGRPKLGRPVAVEVAKYVCADGDLRYYLPA